MCRGANLGVCVTTGCDERIACQDYAPHCNGHSWQANFCLHDDDECDCPPFTEPPPDDPDKRHAYDLAAAHKRVERAESAQRSAKTEATEAHRRLHALMQAGRSEVAGGDHAKREPLA